MPTTTLGRGRPAVRNLRCLAIAGTLMATLTGLAAPASAAEYPDHPVRITVPFGPGGVADITVRIVADRLSEKLGKQFYIENEPGAGGIQAARSALQGGTDGYTLAMLTNGTSVSVPLFKKLPFDPVKAFVPISSLGTFEFLIAVNAASPYKTLGDFLAAAKAKPGALNAGTVIVGSTQNLAAQLFKSTAGVDFSIVPYRTTPDAMVALLRDDVQIVIDSYAALKAGLSDGKLRVLATTGGTHSQVLPDVPTVQEAGVKNYDVLSWNALFAPAGTPPAVVSKLNGALQEILSEPETKKKLLDLGIEAKASTPEEIEARLVSDIDKWGKVIAQAGIPKQ